MIPARIYCGTARSLSRAISDSIEPIITAMPMQSRIFAAAARTALPVALQGFKSVASIAMPIVILIADPSCNAARSGPL